MNEQTYLDELADMWVEKDPVPDDLSDKMVAALAIVDIDQEYELLHLQERASELAGARAEDSQDLTISFGRAERSVLLRVSKVDDATRRVDGWVAPAQQVRVKICQGQRDWVIEADESGRFELPRVPTGLTRVVFGPSVGDSVLFTTPAFEL